MSFPLFSAAIDPEQGEASEVSVVRFEAKQQNGLVFLGLRP
jgi:hypothetical protein